MLAILDACIATLLSALDGSEGAVLLRDSGGFGEGLFWRATWGHINVLLDHQSQNARHSVRSDRCMLEHR